MVQRLAELQKRPKSSIISELIEAIMPPLIRTVAILEAAKDAPDDVKKGLKNVVEDIERELSSTTGAAEQQMDFVSELLKGKNDTKEDAA